MTTSNVVQQEAVKIGNEWYIPLNLVISQPEVTIQQCKNFKPKDDPSSDIDNLYLGLDSEKDRTQQQNIPMNRFKWTYEPSFIFAYVVTAIGIDRVKPKEIQCVFPARYGLTTQMLGSHLQKYRQKIMKEYGVNSNAVQNYMVPCEFNKKQIAVMAAQWRDPNFKGLTIQQVRRNLTPD